MSVTPQTYKGMRDHLPPAMILRDHIITILKRIFEAHGYDPLSTPTIEYTETLIGKIGDEERLIYSFEDHGGRHIALRYDQTVPLARVVAQYTSEIVLPFKRYAIGPSYRGERPQRGRYREFSQADIDIVGTSSPLADAETIAIAGEAIKALGFSTFTTLINHRDILHGLACAADVPPGKAGHVYRIVDKFDKIGLEGVEQDLLQQGIPGSSVDRILDFMEIEGEASAVLSKLRTVLVNDEKGLAGVANLEAIIQALTNMGVSADTYAISPRLARGLSYYTGAVFETTVAEPAIGSLAGGGRYDDLVGRFSSESRPTVGLAFGIDRLQDVMAELGMGPQLRTVVQAYVTIMSPDLAAESLKLARELRQAGISTLTAYEYNGLNKQLKEASRKGIPFALILGSDELAHGVVQIKNLQTGEQWQSSRAEAIGQLAALRL